MICLLLAGACSVPQSATWEHQEPLPTPYSVNDVFLLSASEAWAVSDTAEVLHTTDGGLTWSSTTLTGGPLPHLQCVHFLDPVNGWVAGNGIWWTADGGATWNMAVPWGTIYDIHFADALRGWACGNGGVVYRSTDGGRNWTWQGLPSTTTLSGIFFLDTQRGWVVNIGGELYRSLDGGASWQLVFSNPSYSNLNTVWFADALEGWVIGGRTFLHTTDGGATWQPQTPPPNTWVHNAAFADRLNAWGVGDGMNVVHTTDGWRTSSTQIPIGSGPRLWGVAAADAQHAMAVGEQGLILFSADAGGRWFERQSGASGYVNRLDANDAAHAWAACDWGDVAWTATGGALWRRTRVAGFDVYGRVLDVDFLPDNLTGWAVGVGNSFGGSTGTVSKSTDGGRTWRVQYAFPDGELKAVAALDALTVVAAGYRYSTSGHVVRSSDGGQTWSNVTPPAYYYSGMDFVDAATGWLSGAIIYKTTNGGLTWVQQYVPQYGAEDVSFADSQNGWAVGWFGTLLRTTNGGQTWTQQNSAVVGTTTLLGVSVVSPTTAWIAGTGGFVARTSNGGTTWVRETLGTNSLNSFPGVAFLDGGYGWVGGSTVPPRGGILRRSAGPPPGFALLHDRVVRGARLELEATGAQAGDPVYFLYSLAGYGAGPCPPQLGGLCLDLLPPITIAGSRAADPTGRAVFAATVPPSAPYGEVHFQAAVPRGAASIKTNTTAALVEP